MGNPLVWKADPASMLTLRFQTYATAVAAGSGDNTSSTGVTVDRFSFGASAGQQMPFGAVAAVEWAAVLASGATLSIVLAFQDSADGTTWADFKTAASAVVGTGPSGGGAVNGVLSMGVDLTAARRYVRFNSKPDLSAGGTDTAITAGMMALTGFDSLPAPA